EAAAAHWTLLYMQGRKAGRKGVREREMRRPQVWQRCLVVILLMGAIAATTVAQGQRWTLEQCLERAITSSPEVNEAQAEIRIAESQLAQAKAGRLPQATFTSINGIINGAHGNAVTGRTDNADIGPFTRGELEVVQPLYTFGRLASEIRAASHGVDSKPAATH